MFQASRQIFHRSSRPTSTGAGAPAGADVSPRNVRHPAMRGLDVSPVHGRHCICARCEQPAPRTDAAERPAA